MLVYLFIAHALSFGQSDSAEIPIHHMRASKALAIVKRIGTADPNELVTLSTDDAKGTILAKGNTRGIGWVRSYVELVDVARRQVSFSVSIDSEVDKQSYEVSAKILNDQEWKTSDGDTGVVLSLRPRVNDDGTTTFFGKFEANLEKATQVVFRLRSGASTTLSIGKNSLKAYDPKVDGQLKSWLTLQKNPTVTIHLDK